MSQTCPKHESNMYVQWAQHIFQIYVARIRNVCKLYTDCIQDVGSMYIKSPWDVCRVHAEWIQHHCLFIVCTLSLCNLYTEFAWNAHSGHIHTIYNLSAFHFTFDIHSVHLSCVFVCIFSMCIPTVFDMHSIGNLICSSIGVVPGVVYPIQKSYL